MPSIRSIVTAEQARGRTVGALFLLGFGELWLLLGLGAVAGSHRAAQVLVAAAGVASLALSLVLLQRGKLLPAAAPDAEAEERSRRMFRAVNIIQWVSVATAATILGILHLSEYVVTAIAIIVGLHLFPLASTFRNRQHYVTGTLLILWPLACLATLSRAQVSGITALGAGAVLLLSAVSTLVRLAGALRRGGRSNLPQVVGVAERP
ncbi:hypothetical protein [Terriglobus roseus]|uniref:Uncharacterized protein n=1 Tax=Terriglobus roseus TaxID=392734 RepID=A0A1H4MZD8_9BACT|nr:hypothetical protein [Terriglobus roseus]SEB88008.1 hypothetical protein SAMN05443244_2079 [Terriglobus roseus]